MIKNKVKLTDRPIFNLFKIHKSILSGKVSREVKTSLIGSEMALKKVYKAYEDTNRLNEPTAQIIKTGIEGIADLEFFRVAVTDEVKALKVYSNELKEQNKLLREELFKLKVENQSLKL